MEKMKDGTNCPDIINEDYYWTLSGYKDGCIIEIMANPLVHIYKNMSSDKWDSFETANNEIVAPIFI